MAEHHVGFNPLPRRARRDCCPPVPCLCNGTVISILVFLDSLLRQETIRFATSATARFQSLFFWIHFYDRPGVLRTISVARCFNPCFSGFTSTTAERTPRLLPLAEFQSLFFWIHFYDVAGFSSKLKILLLFQSLFFWIHFYDWNYSSYP